MRALGTLLAGSVLVLAACGDRSTGPPAVAGDPVPTPWRTEVWRGVAVDVPADWAYGGAPLNVAGDPVACPAMATVTASGDRVRAGDPRSVPYVGRPLFLTDVCQAYPFIGPDSDPPAVPSVWLGAEVPAGAEDLGDGWVRETMAVAGTTVTVTSDDRALRDRILGSVDRGGPCAPVLPAPTRVRAMLIEGYGRPQSLEVCAYRRSDAGDLVLAYATVLGEEEARAFARAIDHAERRDMDCGDEPPPEWVTLEMTGSSYPGAPIGVGGTQEMVIGCGVVETGPGQTFELDEGVLDSLRVQGLPAVLSSLIGPMG
ncbi:hypothetical protein [Nocardioides sp.]|uniref:hypothetical protein n=1 Tax=Nocardioides sp. TaxID=35761 RepID=UPI002D7F90EE|nr:hypothetical protein [Nocardioides sp.]HET8958819.1 hypothetical protein [Nocardioides sp.]